MLSKSILGKKLGMTQVFDKEGKMIPVTVVEAGPCYVTQVKTVESDGYSAVQVGFSETKEHRLNKPALGHLGKAGVKPVKKIQEFRVEDVSSYEPGQEIKADVFAEGDLVDVSGIGKGKGFAGAIKRHNFSRGPMAHGSKYHRRPGALGALGPNRVFKGRKLPGRMGGKKVSVQGLEIFQVDAEKNLLIIKGSIPGAKKSIVTIKASVKA